MKHTSKLLKLTFVVALSAFTTVFGEVKLPRLISDGMVLQREVDLKIWGWASAGERISIDFVDSTYSAIADSSGNWRVVLAKLKAGGPHEMNITASNSITIRDIMIGEVWVCSGQSNMELNMKRVSPLYETEIANSENDYIRYFEIPDKYDFTSPRDDVDSGQWQRADPTSVLSFSAVCYFFGKELYEKYHVPIGLINSALGGSPAESWISEEGLKAFPVHYEEALRFKDGTLIKQIQEEDRTRIEAWYSQSKQSDAGYKEPAKPWKSPEYVPSGWATMEIPGYWADESLGTVNGIVWFRKEINIPASMVGKSAQLKSWQNYRR